MKKQLFLILSVINLASFASSALNNSMALSEFESTLTETSSFSPDVIRKSVRSISPSPEIPLLPPSCYIKATVQTANKETQTPEEPALNNTITNQPSNNSEYSSQLNIRKQTSANHPQAQPELDHAQFSYFRFSSNAFLAGCFARLQQK